MKKLAIALLVLVSILTSCGPSLRVTNINTKQSENIRVKKINAIIMNDGQVYMEDIGLARGQLTSQHFPIGWNGISTLEVKTTKFGDVIAFPLEIAGFVTAGVGAFIFGATLTSDNTEDMGSNFLVGGILLGTGAGLNRVGHAMRPSDKKKIKILNASEYNFGLQPTP